MPYLTNRSVAADRTVCFVCRRPWDFLRCIGGAITTNAWTDAPQPQPDEDDEAAVSDLLNQAAFIICEECWRDPAAVQTALRRDFGDDIKAIHPGAGTA